MALADSDDVVAHLGRSLTSGESARVSTILEESSDLVIGYCGTDFEPAPYPGPVVRVVAAMAARSLVAASSGADMVQQQTAGPFSMTFNASASSGDVWLTKADKMKLRAYRIGGGMTSVELVGIRYNITPDEDSSSSSSS